MGRDPYPRLSKICLSLPEATAEAFGSHTTFRVRKKVFAYYLVNHHGDGIIGIVVKADDGVQGQLVASDQEQFYVPAYLGPRGWVGARLDRGPAWGVIETLVRDSFHLVAPKTVTSGAAARRARPAPKASRKPKKRRARRA